ncbi:hypothetical protein [uncultured Lactobacillus sp.]|uniref:hypothetical protein n=1 Tax=uncultured Lactobacillus sp. TaxID=153152 RepID=UPI0025FD43E1|nr:hypothetical protein [uncultured Lactobacillus sp.]
MKLETLSFDWDNYVGKLKSFDRSQIISIMDDYYNSNLSVAKIISKYSISRGIRNLSKEFPLIYIEEKCPYDKSNLVLEMPSRNGNSTRIPKCTICGHELKRNCNCKGCQEKNRKIREQKRKIIISAYALNTSKVKYEDLSVSSKIYLSALLHAGLNDEASKISGEKIIEEKLSPTYEFDRIILEHLLSENIILVDPMSPIEAFSVNDSSIAYYIFKVNYLINVEDDSEGIDNLEYPDRINIIQYKEECLAMWKQIALYECLEYLVEQMREARFEFNPQKKTKLVINHLIEEYSIGQIWNLIYGSVNHAAAWYQKSNVSKKHAANSVITILNNRGDRAKAENWKLNPYHRSYDNKLSQLSMVFFDSILQIGSEGYEKKPSINIIGQ